MTPRLLHSSLSSPSTYKMDDDFGLTQDCVEWNDENAVDLRNQLVNTPVRTGTKKAYSPNQEIEDLWKLLGTPSQQSQTKQLQRSHSYPMPRNHRQQRKRNRIENDDRKRKRPPSADSTNHQTKASTSTSEEDTSYQASVGFEELLRQLDTSEKSKSPGKNANTKLSPVQLKTPTTVHDSASAKIQPPDHDHTNTVMPPPQGRTFIVPSLPSSVHLQKKPSPKKAAIQTPAAKTAPNRITPTAWDLQQKQQPPSISTTNVRAGLPFIAPATSAASEFDDDFDLSEADLAALDAVVSSQTDTRNAAVVTQNIISKTTAKTTAPPPPVPPLASKPDVDDEFGDFNFDFADLDVQIAQKLNGVAAAKPPRESFGDPFGDAFDFSELDKTISERKPKSILKPKERTYRVDMSSLQIPPSNAQVSNLLVSGYDPNRSFVGFSRYQVVAVNDDSHSYTKAVMVKSWNSEMGGEDKTKAVLHRPSNSQGKLTRQVEETVGEGWIFLRGEWYHTSIQPKDTIHLCSLSGRYQTNLDALPVILHTNEPSGSDRDDLILVLHPDTLVAPTTVSETVSCSRRAVLRSRLGSTGISSKAALYGTMRHLLFEKCMNHQDFSIKFAKDSVLAIVRQTAENLVALGIKEAEARKEILRVLPQLQQFRSEFMDANDRPLDKASKLEGNGVNPDLNFVTRSVEGTEESLVSPEFGLKGNVDVTVKATTQDVPSHFVTNPTGPETSRVGIELKTGHNQNPQNAHMAQLALYTLMLSARYGRSSLDDRHASKTGMLLYVNPEGMRAVRVSPLIPELKSLIGQRNTVASELRKVTAPRGVQIVYEGEDAEDEKTRFLIGPAPSASLPEVLSAPQPCNRCYANRECMLYGAADLSTKPEGQLNRLKESHAKLLAHFCGHLEEQDLQYFLDWDRLIDLEADATAKSITSAWLTPSLELEKSTGRTVSSLVLDERFVSPSQDEGGSDFVPITLHRSSDAESNTEFSTLSIEKGNLVVISADATSLASSSEEHRKKKTKATRNTLHIARGFVHSLDDSKIVVNVSAQESRQLNREHETAKIQRRTMKLRLDRDDVQTGLGTTRQNLINLFTGDVKPFENSKSDPKLSQNHFVRNRYAWLRNAVVKLHAPQYDQRKCHSMFDQANSVRIPGCDINSLEQEFYQLNEDQRDAVKKVFSAKDYSLIQGLPGTGKSSTIVFVARLLAAHGKRVLITSYTHAAVDNLMMKLIDKGVSATAKSGCSPRMIRVGKKASSHLAVHPILLSEAATNLQQSIDQSSRKPSSDALQTVLSNARIVGVTALSIPRSSVLVGQDFDVVIADEAGQISQPAILGALMAADTFVLVGDHKQLPPLVTSEAAEKAGFGVSMLSRLAEKHADCIAQLTLQYRMHEDICQICNDIVYAGKLKCANEVVRSQLLQLSRFQQSDSWASRIVSPKRPVVFVNTDFFDRDTSQSITKQLVGLERRPEKSGHGNMVNDNEVSIVKRIIHELLESGLPASSIGVISPFRAQVRQLNESEAMSHWKTAGLEISTIDRYQGRDKQVIIISFVRSNSKGYSGRLLNDFRRLNVAVSRAMKKLILVGSYSTLHGGSDVLRPVLEGFTARKQVVKIPEHILRSQLS